MKKAALKERVRTQGAEIDRLKAELLRWRPEPQRPIFNGVDLSFDAIHTGHPDCPCDSCEAARLEY